MPDNTLKLVNVQFNSRQVLADIQELRQSLIALGRNAEQSNKRLVDSHVRLNSAILSTIRNYRTLLGLQSQELGLLSQRARLVALQGGGFGGGAALGAGLGLASAGAAFGAPGAFLSGPGQATATLLPAPIRSPTPRLSYGSGALDSRIAAATHQANIARIAGPVSPLGFLPAPVRFGGVSTPIDVAATRVGGNAFRFGASFDGLRGLTENVSRGGLAAYGGAAAVLRGVRRIPLIGALASPLGLGVTGAAVAGGGVASNFASSDVLYRLGTVSQIPPGPERQRFLGRAQSDALEFASAQGIDRRDLLNTRYNLISGGVPVAESEAFSRNIAQVARITSGSPTEIGSAFTTIANNFPGTSSEDIAGLLSQTQLQFQLENFAQLGYGLPYALPTSAGQGIPVEQTLATIGQFNSLGFFGSQAGTLFRNYVPRIQDERLISAVNQYQSRLGDSPDEFYSPTRFESGPNRGGLDLVSTSTDLSRQLNRIYEADPGAAPQIERIVGRLAGPVINLLSKNVTGLETELERLSGAFRDVVPRETFASLQTLSTNLRAFGQAAGGYFEARVGQGLSAIGEAGASALGGANSRRALAIQTGLIEEGFGDVQLTRSELGSNNVFGRFYEQQIRSQGGGSPFAGYANPANAVDDANAFIDVAAIQYQSAGQIVDPEVRATRQQQVLSRVQPFLDNPILTGSRSQDNARQQLGIYTLSDRVSYDQDGPGAFLQRRAEGLEPDDQRYALRLLGGITDQRPVFTQRRPRNGGANQFIDPQAVADAERLANRTASESSRLIGRLTPLASFAAPGDATRADIERLRDDSAAQVALIDRFALPTGVNGNLEESFFDRLGVAIDDRESLQNIADIQSRPTTTLSSRVQQAYDVYGATQGVTDERLRPNVLNPQQIQEELIDPFNQGFLPLEDQINLAAADERRNVLEIYAIQSADPSVPTDEVERNRARALVSIEDNRSSQQEIRQTNETREARNEGFRNDPYSLINYNLDRGDEVDIITRELQARNPDVEINSQAVALSLDAKRSTNETFGTDSPLEAVRAFDGNEKFLEINERLNESLDRGRSVLEGYTDALEQLADRSKYFNEEFGVNVVNSITNVTDAFADGLIRAGISGEGGDFIDNFRNVIGGELEGLASDQLRNALKPEGKSIFASGLEALIPGLFDDDDGRNNGGAGNARGIGGRRGTQPRAAPRENDQGFLGNFVTDLFSSFFAEGGIVRGPGSTKSDSIPAMLSNGEFVVNAASTNRFRATLERINNTQGYNTGGFVSGDYSPASGTSSGGDSSVNISVNVAAGGAGGAQPSDPRAIAKQGEILGEAIKGVLLAESRKGGILGKRFADR